MVKSKMSLITAILFAVMCFNIYSQNNSTTKSNSSENSTVVSEAAGSGSFEQTPFGQFQTDNNTNVTVNNNNSVKQPSLVGTILKMIVMLILVIAAIYGIMLFFKRKNNVTKSEDDFLRRVSTLNLGPNKSVEIITLLDKGYLVGVTESGINLISEIEDKELIESLNLNFDKKSNTSKPVNFNEVLEMFVKGGKKGSVFDTPPENKQ